MDFKYHTKPEEIEAFRLTPSTRKDRGLWPTWMIVACQLDRGTPGSAYSDELYGDITIQAVEGPLVAAIGDWIVKGKNGGIFPVKPDTFAATYVKA